MSDQVVKPAPAKGQRWCIRGGPIMTIDHINDFGEFPVAFVNGGAWELDMRGCTLVDHGTSTATARPMEAVQDGGEARPVSCLRCGGRRPAHWRGFCDACMTNAGGGEIAALWAKWTDGARDFPRFPRPSTATNGSEPALPLQHPTGCMCERCQKDRKPLWREVSTDGRTWIPYERLTDPDPFEAYRHRRVDGVVAMEVAPASRAVGVYLGSDIGRDVDIGGSMAIADEMERTARAARELSEQFKGFHQPGTNPAQPVAYRTRSVP